MKWTDFSRWTAMGVLALAAGVALARGGMLPALPWMPSGPPCLEYPRELVWEEVEILQAVQAEVEFRNRGGEELFIHQIHTSCGCFGLEKLWSGTLHPVNSLRLGPGQTEKLIVRLEARGIVGAAMRQRITLQTNDPSQPEVQLEALIRNVTGGVTGIPAIVEFGEIAPEDAASQEIDIVDGAVSPRQLGSVSSANPDLFAVDILDRELRRMVVEGKAVGAAIGRIRVRTLTREPGSYHGQILCQLLGESRRPSVIPVHVVVQPWIETTPGSMVFPLRTEAGLLWEQISEIRVRGNGTVFVESVSAPPFLQVSTMPASDGKIIVQVRVKNSEAGSQPGFQTGRIVVNLKRGDRHATAQVDVRVLSP
jgi:hypothetical protein